jgi:hypothetical protein
MKPMVIISALFLTAACGSEGELPERHVDQALQATLDQFMADAAEHGAVMRDLDVRVIRVVDVMPRYSEDDDVATCWAYDGWGEIYFQREFWDGLDAINQRRLAYHEFAHCMLGATHRDGLWLSIMSPIFYPVRNVSEGFWQQSVRELFEPGSI